MVSVNTTANAYVLAGLRQINSDLATAQARIGTGKKVNSASDDPAVWTIAQGIRSDLNAQDNLKSGITVAKGKADSAVAALNTITTLLGQIKTIADNDTSNPPSSATADINKITALQAQITAVANSATFQGENWITDAAATKSVNIGVSGGTAVTSSVTTLKLNDSGTALTLALANPASLSDVQGDSALATTALTAVAAYQATLSTFSSVLSTQQDFLTSLSTVRNTALSALTDADLTEESAKVTALQTQQQLAYQALSIGNSSAANILRLFQ